MRIAQYLPFTHLTQSTTPGKPRPSFGAEGVLGQGGEGVQEEEEYDALLEQENRDMDTAIRESEKERDVIQVRDVLCMWYNVCFEQVVYHQEKRLCNTCLCFYL